MLPRLDNAARPLHARPCMDTLSDGDGAKRSPGPARILVVDDESTLRGVIARGLSREGFDPVEAADGAEALERYHALRPPVAVVDVGLPGPDGLSLLAAIKRLDPGACVLLMSGRDDEELILRALRGGASGFLRKPFTIADLAREIRRVLAHRNDIARPAGHSSHLLEETRCFSLPTGKADYLPVIDLVARPLHASLDEGEVLDVRIGIEEMILNAIEHGNLGISSAEKEAAVEDGRLAELLAARMAVGGNADKRVWIETRLDAEAFRVTVRDEGPGFDWRSLVAREPGTGGVYAGRGLLLARVHFDRVSWNESGNEVTLVKGLRGPA